LQQVLWEWKFLLTFVVFFENDLSVIRIDNRNSKRGTNLYEFAPIRILLYQWAVMTVPSHKWNNGIYEPTVRAKRVRNNGW